MAAPKYSPADDLAHMLEVMRHVDEGMKLSDIAKKMGLTRYRVTMLATEGKRLRQSTEQPSVSTYPLPHTKADEKLLG